MKDNDHIILENLYNNITEAYWDSRKEPRNQSSEYGYFDADKLIGKRVWVHTNRTNREEGINGMFGVYIPSNKTRSNRRYGYTNEIRLNNVVFDVDINCIMNIGETQKRDLCAGILGDIIKTEGDLSGFEPFKLDPLNKIYHYFKVNDPERKKIIGADEVYMNATEDGKYIVVAKGIITEEKSQDERQ